MLKIATWNVNSIKARKDRLLGFLQRETPDVLCLQELKAELRAEGRPLLNERLDEKGPVPVVAVATVTARREGRKTMYRTNADQLRTIHEWAAMFEKYWRGQLRRIKAHAEDKR